MTYNRITPSKTEAGNPCKQGVFSGKMSTHQSCFFKVLPVAEKTADPLPIRTPRTRRSFRCLLRGGCFWMGDLFHHALIGTVGKVHKSTSVHVQPNPPTLSQSWERVRFWRIHPPSRRWKIEQPGPPVKGKPPINGGADAPLTDSSRLF